MKINNSIPPQKFYVTNSLASPRADRSTVMTHEGQNLAFNKKGSSRRAVQNSHNSYQKIDEHISFELLASKIR